MRKIPNWVLGLLVVVTGLAAVAAFPVNFAEPAQAQASTPTADEVSFCHADAGATDGSGLFVIRAASAVYGQHRRHGDCLVADGTPAGDPCVRVDADHDELCDQNGDPAIGD